MVSTKRYYVKENGGLSVLFLFLIVCTGCSPCRKGRFIKYSPSEIGIAMGRDIKTKESLTTSEEMAIGALTGAVGALLVYGSAEEGILHCEMELDKILQDRLLKQLQDKGYKAEIISSKKLEKFKWMENLDVDSKKNLNKLVNKYELEEIKDQYDAIVFMEYCIEVREFETGNLEKLEIKDMQPQMIVSKIWIYETKSSKNLYYNIISHGYPAYSKKRLSETVPSLAELKDIPNYSELDSKPELE